MTVDQKMDRKKIAAIAAVMQYLQAESCEMQPTGGLPAAGVTVAVPDKSKMCSTTLWGASGRQKQMHLRDMVQMKAFR